MLYKHVKVALGFLPADYRIVPKFWKSVDLGNVEISSEQNYTQILWGSARFGVPTADRRERIAYGTEALVNQFPFMVRLVVIQPTTFTYTDYCAGTVIAPTYVLTAGEVLKR